MQAFGQRAKDQDAANKLKRKGRLQLHLLPRQHCLKHCVECSLHDMDCVSLKFFRFCSARITSDTAERCALCSSGYAAIGCSMQLVAGLLRMLCQTVHAL